MIFGMTSLTEEFVDVLRKIGVFDRDTLILFPRITSPPENEQALRACG